MMVATIPMYAWIRSGKRTVPMTALVCIFFGVYAGFGAITQPNSIRILNVDYELSWESINKAVMLSFLGIATLVLTLMVLGRFGWVPRSSIDLRVDPRRRILSVFTIAGLALVFRFLASSGWLPLGGHVQLSQVLLLLSSVLAAVFYYRVGDASSAMKIGLAVLLVYISSVGLTTGMLEAAFLPLVAVLIVRCAVKRQLPVMLTIVGLLGVFMVNTAKHDYRNRVWYGDEDSGTAQKLAVWQESTARIDFRAFFLGTTLANDKTITWRESIGRFSIVARLAWVCQNTPSRIPYLAGDSYKPFIYAPIPRLIWPDKPIFSDVLTQVDQTYGFVGSSVTAAFGIGYIGESYANYGVTGVFVIMVLQGLLLFFLDSVFNGPFSEGGVAIFVVLLVAMLNGVGSALIIIYGNILQMAITCALVVFPFTVRAPFVGSRPDRRLFNSPLPSLSNRPRVG